MLIRASTRLASARLATVSVKRRYGKFDDFEKNVMSREAKKKQREEEERKEERKEHTGRTGEFGGHSEKTRQARD